MSKNLKKRGGGKKSKVFGGRYAYKKPLGRGAGGSVYLAEDLRSNNRQVALKVLTAEACNTVQGKMLRREFDVLSKLDHPNLVRVYDYGSLPDGGVFLAEEYIDGFSLQDARALLEPSALINLTLQILQGLSYLHGMRMIHRDIKPANVMLLWLDDASALPMAKLVDFGLSSMDPKRDTLRGGTRSYMAPEVIRGDKGEPRSDLYSLGVTLYYVLCGVLPFGPRSKDDPPTTDEDFRPPEPHRLNPEVPLTLSRFTMALLRQLPDVEYADAGEALQALASDTEVFEALSGGRLANSLDVAATPVLKGYFERGILERRVAEDELIVEWISGEEDQEHIGHMYMISASAGAGKSRLLRDVVSSTKLNGQLAIHLSCTANQPPGFLMCQLALRVLDVCSSHQVEEVEKYRLTAMVRELLATLDHEPTDDELDLVVGLGWVRSLLEDAVKGLAPSRMVIFIDDLHLADADSVALVSDWFANFKAQDRPDFVVTLEPGELADSLDQGQGTHVMPIEGITREDVEMFFTGQLAIEGMPDAWLDQVALLAEGRPAYIEEVCRCLIDNGALRRMSARAWAVDLAELNGFQLPRATQESFRRRMSAVGAGGRECLEILALVGRPILWEAVRDLLFKGGTTDEQAERILQTLQWRHLTLVDLDTSGRFVRLIREELGEVVEKMIGPKWARAIHRRIGAHLLENWRTHDADAQEAARHLELGGLDADAASFFEIAATDAAREGEYRLAYDDLASSRRLQGADSSTGMRELRLAQSALASYRPALCRNHLEAAGEHAERTALDWLMYRVFISASSVALSLGDLAWAREWKDRLRDCLPAMSQQGEVLGMEAMLCLSHGKIPEASKLLESCVKRARHFGNNTGLLMALSRYAHVRLLGGYHGEAMALYQDAIDLAADVDDSSAMGAVLHLYGSDLRRSGQLGEAKEALTESLMLLRSGPQPEHWIGALFELAKCQAAAGEFSEARRRAIEASYFAQKLTHRPMEQEIALFLAMLVVRGNAQNGHALKSMERMIKSFSNRADVAVGRAETLIDLGAVLTESGHGERGEELSNEGRALASQIGARVLLTS